MIGKQLASKHNKRKIGVVKTHFWFRLPLKKYPILTRNRNPTFEIIRAKGLKI